MSELKTSKFKKRIWGYSESVEVLSSKDSGMVVDDSDIQGFTHFDVLRHFDLNSSTKLSSKNVSSTCSNVVGDMHEVISQVVATALTHAIFIARL